MRAILIYVVIHLVMLLVNINMNAVSVAFPELTSEFNASLVVVGWVLSIYQLVATVAAVLIGKVSDLLGKKITFLSCTLLFTIGSLLSAVAPNVYLLIIFRIIQSIGGGGLIPVIVGVISDIFPNSRQKAIGFSMSIISVGGVIGPSIGGFLVSNWGWRSIFWVNVPFGILACLLVILLLNKDKGRPGKIDYAGAGYIAGALVAIMSGISNISSNNSILGWIICVLLLGGGAILIFLFLRHNKKSSEPILQMELLIKKPFSKINISSFILGTSLFGFTSFIPLFAVSIYHLSTLESSYMLTARSIGFIIITLAASTIISKWGYRKPLIAGILVNGLTTIIVSLDPNLLGIAGNTTTSLYYLTGVGVVGGLGMGLATFCFANGTIDLMPERATVISGIRSLFVQSGGAISIALISPILQITGKNIAGFEIAFGLLGLLFIATIPTIFYLPEKPINNKIQS